jgi:hypothetical protein
MSLIFDRSFNLPGPISGERKKTAAWTRWEKVKTKT